MHSAASYTVRAAVDDWLAEGLSGRAPKTVSTQREVLEPLLDIIGAVPLGQLSAANVRSALKDLAAARATRTVAMAHAGLARAIRHAEANDKVRRNVATLVNTPAGQRGRPSKSLTFEQAVALIRAARPYGLYAYVVLSLRSGYAPRKRGLFGGITSTWTLTQACLRASMCGAPYGHTGTSRPASPGALSRCRRWPWRRLQNTGSARPATGYGRVSFGKKKGSCSAPRSGRGSMQATSADRFVRSAGKRESGRTGPLGSCATRSGAVVR